MASEADWFQSRKIPGKRSRALYAAGRPTGLYLRPSQVASFRTQTEVSVDQQRSNGSNSSSSMPRAAAHQPRSSQACTTFDQASAIPPHGPSPQPAQADTHALGPSNVGVGSKGWSHNHHLEIATDLWPPEQDAMQRLSHDIPWDVTNNINRQQQQRMPKPLDWPQGLSLLQMPDEWLPDDGAMWTIYDRLLGQEAQAGYHVSDEFTAQRLVFWQAAERRSAHDYAAVAAAFANAADAKQTVHERSFLWDYDHEIGHISAVLRGRVPSNAGVPIGFMLKHPHKEMRAAYGGAIESSHLPVAMLERIWLPASIQAAIKDDWDDTCADGWQAAASAIAAVSYMADTHATKDESRFLANNVNGWPAEADVKAASAADSNSGAAPEAGPSKLSTSAKAKERLQCTLVMPRKLPTDMCIVAFPIYERCESYVYLLPRVFRLLRLPELVVIPPSFKGIRQTGVPQELLRMLAEENIRMSDYPALMYRFRFVLSCIRGPLPHNGLNSTL
ncbi:hypothetical protein WJX84_012259 [Apatococcus fuscideae]|uniref:Uncharacterized protein n=1 Tax=Apatococcus fuscideae TaxID=2026836 RepID=A0AAW1RN71_9CHLO